MKDLKLKRFILGFGSFSITTKIKILAPSFDNISEKLYF